jgi:hypothetical protein
MLDLLVSADGSGRGPDHLVLRPVNYATPETHASARGTDPGYKTINNHISYSQDRLSYWNGGRKCIICNASQFIIKVQRCCLAFHCINMKMVQEFEGKCSRGAILAGRKHLEV